MARFTALLLLLFPVIILSGQKSVFQDNNGVIRWAGDKSEVALFGANYCLPSACDYRAAGYVTSDRKKAIEQDMAHFARMGWDGMRVCLWGDYQNSDTSGNLVNNDHLDLMDYLIFKARERGIYMLFSPIVTYSSQWPDALDDTVSARGFSSYFDKGELGTNPRAIAVQQNYLRQILNHVNPYTGVAIKDDPWILFVEMINEPWHHSEDVAGSVKYINALVEAVRSTGCNKLLFHNYTQDFNMALPLQQSKIDGISIGWYPTGLVAGHTLPGNYLPAVDEFAFMRKPELAKHSRIVYEFDNPDQLNGYMYPAMARTFRTVGAQFAAMFSYDMLVTAPYNLGWQTHYLNMVYTPSKAVSTILAAEVMKNIPLYKNYGKYPANASFGPFRLSYEDDLGEMATSRKFIYSNNTQTIPPNPASLEQVTGYGSSPVAAYEGKGIYFLDKIKPGVWRLEVYPDAVQIADPFAQMSPGRIVTRTISRTWDMELRLPDLGKQFTVSPLNAGNQHRAAAVDGRFAVRPGVYILSGDPAFDLRSLPAKLGQLGMSEFVAPDDQALPANVALNHQTEYPAGRHAVIEAEVYSAADPGSVTLYLARAGAGRFRPIPMKKVSGYLYRAEIPAERMQPGWIEYCISVKEGQSVITWPAGIAKSPEDWDFPAAETWQSRISPSGTPIRLLDPAEDLDDMAFTRIGDGIRWGIFQLMPASNTGEAAIRLGLPLSYDRTLDDYTVSVPVGAKLAARKDYLDTAKKLTLHLRGVSQRQELFVTLVESDGTSWSRRIEATSEWGDLELDLASFDLSKGVKLPLGYPGRWNYWFTPAEGRGFPGDGVQLDKVEWLQLSIRPSAQANEPATEDSFLEISGVFVIF